MKKVLWSDIPDDAPLPKWPPDEDVVVTKHGVKVRSGSAASRNCETVHPKQAPPPDKTVGGKQTKKT
jgi:hypothetical protein